MTRRGWVVVAGSLFFAAVIWAIEFDPVPRRPPSEFWIDLDAADPFAEPRGQRVGEPVGVEIGMVDGGVAQCGAPTPAWRWWLVRIGFPPPTPVWTAWYARELMDGQHGCEGWERWVLQPCPRQR